MRKTLAGAAGALAIVVTAAFAGAEAPPVDVTHTLTGYSKGAASVTLTYVVQVRNPGEKSLGPVSLSLVPHPPFITSKTAVTVDTLAPKGTASMRVKVVTPLLREQGYFADKPLLWAGRCSEAGGRVIEFPVKSRQGGAK